MKQKQHLFSLFLVWAVLWAICIGSSIGFYRFHLQYPEDRIPVYGIYAMLLLGILFSVLWYFCWRAFWNNQHSFDSERPEQELNLPHSIFDASVPLSVQGNELRINRGFHTETIICTDIYWLHHYKVNAKGGRKGLYLHIYLGSGKHIRALFEPLNTDGVFVILEKLKNEHPRILISEGLWSQAYNECKFAYKHR